MFSCVVWRRDGRRRYATGTTLSKNVARTRSFFERRALTSGRRVDFNAEKSASLEKRGLQSRPVGVLFPMKNGSI